MYTNELLDAYKKAKNYIQDKQVAHDLGLSRQKISAIRNGQRYLSENEALFLAKEIGADTESVLVYLAADKAKTSCCYRWVYRRIKRIRTLASLSTSR